MVPNPNARGAGVATEKKVFGPDLVLERAEAWLRENGWGHVSTFGGSDLGCQVAMKALEMSLAEETVVERLQVLEQSGAISRFGAVYRPNVAGASTLVALAVPEQELDGILDHFSD